MLVGGCTAFFYLFDQLAEEKDKNTISWYLFGFFDVNFEQFDRSCISFILGLFRNRSNNFLLWRIFALSFISTSMSFCVLYYIFNIGAEESEARELTANLFFDLMDAPSGEVLFFIFIIGTISLVSLPFDYISLRISSFIFEERTLVGWKLIFGIFIDAILSFSIFILPLYFIYFHSGIFETKSVNFSAPFLILMGTIISSLSVLVFSIFQIILLFFGLIIRFFVIFTRLNRLTVIRSNSHKYPFTYIGILFGVFLFIFNYPT